MSGLGSIPQVDNVTERIHDSCDSTAPAHDLGRSRFNSGIPHALKHLNQLTRLQHEADVVTCMPWV